MQIQLKQSEITAALKSFIAGQGFDLEDRHVEIEFNAGRKGAGISADIHIGDPNSENQDRPEPTKKEEKVDAVQKPKKTRKAKTATKEAKVFEQAEEVSQEEKPVQEIADDETSEAVTQDNKSLFG